MNSNHDWQDRNIGIQALKKTREFVGAKAVTDWASHSGISGVVSKGLGATRNAAGASIDPLVGERITQLTDVILQKRTPKIKFKPVSEPPHSPAPTGTVPSPDNDGGEEVRKRGEEVRKRAPKPFHMFNIDTGELEEIRNLDYTGYTPVYCILSHSWLGTEISYEFVQKVKENVSKGREGKAKYKYLDLAHPKNDVENIIRECDENIKRAKSPPVQMKVQPDPDQLKVLYQQRISADKIAKTVEKAKEIFDKIYPDYNPNRHPWKRYVWDDTCCINKTVVDEHNQSIAMMGEWYTNAEFCLVYLDNDPRNAPENREEERVSLLETRSYPEAQFKTFADISDPKKRPYWSTRAWTLQELCLSKEVFFYNNAWTLLNPDCIGIMKRCDQEVKKQVANFSNVPLEEVCRGGRRSKYPALKVLALSATRNCTKETDQAYSLMGMLGVKFPAFHAEGLTKALSRLLDETVIVSRDVSVFNWWGASGCGSPIKGRSMYPAKFDVYEENYGVLQGNSGCPPPADLDEQMTSVLQHDREIFHKIVRMIEGMLSFIAAKTKEENSKVIAQLQPSIEYLANEVQKLEPKDWVERSKKVDLLKYAFKILQEDYQALKEVPLPPPSYSKPTDESSSPTEKPGTKRTSSLPNFATGREFLRSSKKKTVSALRDIRINKNAPDQDKFPESLRSAIKDFIENDGRQTQDIRADENSSSALTRKIYSGWPEKTVEGHQDKSKDHTGEKSSKSDRPHSTNHDIDKANTICPNPIIINNSGIESVFDIQRIVMKFKTIDGKDVEKWRSESSRSDDAMDVEHTEKQISGECTISTGRAAVTVDFSCTATMLRRQLDICDVVEDTKLQHDEKTTTGEENSEEHRVVRMVKFIQQTDMDMIAGEWVLMRFSGVPNANWFLCLLELGSTHEFYGWRIPTGRIDFNTARLEDGIRNYWRGYMNAKKKALCKILDETAQNKRFKNETDEMLEHYLNEDLQGGARMLGKAATRLAGVWYFELDEASRKKRLRDTALENAGIPKSLQAVVLSLEEYNFLPDMFTASQRVHMF